MADVMKKLEELLEAYFLLGFIVGMLTIAYDLKTLKDIEDIMKKLEELLEENTES